MQNSIMQLEFNVLDAIAEQFWCPAMDIVIPALTQLGDNGMVWIVFALVLLCLPKERRNGAQVLLALLFSTILCNLILKNLFSRVRPCDINTAVQLLIPHPLDRSFPSGHTSAGFAVATALMKNKAVGRKTAMVFAVLIGFSRLYLYVHFPTDVLGGIAVGVLMGLLAAWAYPRLEKKFRRRGGS